MEALMRQAAGFGEDSRLKTGFEKRRNTIICISGFPNRGIGAKDPSRPDDHRFRGSLYTRPGDRRSRYIQHFMQTARQSARKRGSPFAAFVIRSSHSHVRVRESRTVTFLTRTHFFILNIIPKMRENFNRFCTFEAQKVIWCMPWVL